MKKKCLLPIMAILLCTCLQVKAQMNEKGIQSILKNGMEKIDMQSGFVVVMDAKTGMVVDTVSIGLKGDNKKLLHEKVPTTLFSATALDMCLLSKNITLNDSVDIGDGSIIVNGQPINDYNWKRGGFGKTTLRAAFMMYSNVGIIKAIQKSFPTAESYSKMVLTKTGIAIDGINFTRYKLTPLQITKLYNDIATSDDADIKSALKASVGKESYMRKVFNEKDDILGRNHNNGYHEGIHYMEFCGSFPSTRPQYTVLVWLSKKDAPAHVNMAAAEIFKNIYELYKVNVNK